MPENRRNQSLGLTRLFVYTEKPVEKPPPPPRTEALRLLYNSLHILQRANRPDVLALWCRSAVDRRVCFRNLCSPVRDPGPLFHALL